MFDAVLQNSVVDPVGLSAALTFAALFFATFVSEDAACIGAGSLAASGEVSFALALCACFAGIVVGDLGLYWAGRTLGRRVGHYIVSEASLVKAARRLERNGPSAVFVSRFVTGLRLPTYLAAGFLRTNFRTFSIYFIVAAGIWTPLLVGSAALSANVVPGGILLAALALFVSIRTGIKLATWRGRRLMVGKLKRFVNWEFWPLPVFYLPVVIYVAALAIRYRSLTVFTCANPAMPAGGFVGESKHAIYAMLASSRENDEFLLKHCLVDGRLSLDEKLDRCERFMFENQLDFPIVVKPNAGERGKGVRVIESPTQLRDTLASVRSDQIVQEYFDGDEVSVFYYRFPEAAEGSIFSVTEKILPSVTGDGMKTLEELILKDRRAVCLAEKYFEENAERLGYVPAAGEEIRIINIGTHSRGAIFRDGGHFVTPQLEQTIDAICRRIDGFNFGRFDIRYSSLKEFQSGRGFKIIELNGVTSESTNIYDPRYSLLDAYRFLFRQWSLAFAIARSNRDRGARPAGIMTLFRSSFVSFFGVA
jgi:membrane protein DedA with SNARE-associated domain